MSRTPYRRTPSPTTPPNISLPAGLHTIAISYTNDYATGCDRDLGLDRGHPLPINITTSSSSPPPPPPPPGYQYEASRAEPMTRRGYGRWFPRDRSPSAPREPGLDVHQRDDLEVAGPAGLQDRSPAGRGAIKCNGAPNMLVEIDGAAGGVRTRTPTGFADFSANVRVPRGHARDRDLVHQRLQQRAATATPPRRQGHPV